jgi:hypothetical protein
LVDNVLMSLEEKYAGIKQCYIPANLCFCFKSFHKINPLKNHILLQKKA